MLIPRRIQRHAGLPPKGETRASEIRGLTRANPIPRRLTEMLCMPYHLHETLQERWHGAPLKDYSVLHGEIGIQAVQWSCDLHLSCHGEVEFVVDWRKREGVACGPVVWDEDADGEEKETSFIIDSRAEDVHASTREWLEGVWKPVPVIETVQTLKAEKRVGPNDKCPCGSGKKHKKCCGR